MLTISIIYSSFRTTSSLRNMKYAVRTHNSLCFINPDPLYLTGLYCRNTESHPSRFLWSDSKCFVQ